MKGRLKQEVQVRELDDGPSRIRYGRVARADQDSEVHIYNADDNPPTRVHRGFVEGRKVQKFDLAEGKKYIVAVIGSKIAGVATTAEHEIVAPFELFIDPPDEGSLKFVRLSIPANKPVLPGSPLELAIKKAFGTGKT